MRDSRFVRGSEALRNRMCDLNKIYIIEYLCNVIRRYCYHLTPPMSPIIFITILTIIIITVYIY